MSAVPTHRVGKRVRVVANVSTIIGADEIGTVISHVTDDHGAVIADPMHIVWVTGVGKDGFWAEELGEP